MKKKLISLILCGVMAFGLVSCGDSKEKETSNNSNKTTTSSSSNNSNSKVYTEDSDDKKEESTPSKDEYKSMTTEEAIKFNETKVYEMHDWLEKKGFSNELKQYSKDNLDVPVNASYVVEEGELPYYESIGYNAEIVENKVIVKYEFHYYVDKEGIANGTSEVPKARDLLIAEPYKIMTGDEISEETLNEIDEAIEDAYLNGNDEDEIELEVNGPFKLVIVIDGLDFGLQVISSGDGTGN